MVIVLVLVVMDGDSGGDGDGGWCFCWLLRRVETGGLLVAWVVAHEMLGEPVDGVDGLDVWDSVFPLGCVLVEGLEEGLEGSVEDGVDGLLEVLHVCVCPGVDGHHGHDVLLAEDVDGGPPGEPLGEQRQPLLLLQPLLRLQMRRRQVVGRNDVACLQLFQTRPRPERPLQPRLDPRPHKRLLPLKHRRRHIPTLQNVPRNKIVLLHPPQQLVLQLYIHQSVGGVVGWGGKGKEKGEVAYFRRRL